jgi:DNA segregation ATPase FtsK/SpoIIIE, S-DNA-T family
MPFSSKQKQREYQRQYQKNRRKKDKSSSTDYDNDTSKISPETKMAIIVTIFFVSGVFSLLSFFNLTGPLGEYVKNAFLVSFGWGAVVFPIILFLFGIIFLKGIRYEINRWRLVGVAVIFPSFLGIIHHISSFEFSSKAALEGRGGGYVGFLISHPTNSIAGYWGTLVLLVGILIVGVFLAFSGLFFKEKNQDEEDQEEETGFQGDEITEESQSFVSGILEKIRVWKYNKEYGSLDKPEDNEEETVENTDSPLEEDLKNTEENKDPILETDKKILPPKIRKSVKIPLDLLESSKDKPSADDVVLTKEKIEKTLDTFGIRVEMGDVSIGPTITQYTLKPSLGVKLARITSLVNDLSLALAAHPLRIEAPIPGKSLVGIEVPNKATATVKLKDILSSSSFKSRTSNLSICLGKDVTGKSWVVDLGKMPHLLIAGSTGSGKSVAINSLIVSLLYQNSPDDLKIVLVDPKKVELTSYNDIPYLLTPVITDVKKTVNALRWVVSEMERRYQVLSNRGKRNLAAYNESNKSEAMPCIVFIIDELADLMAVAANEVEAAIVRLAQMARAVGIHLVLATQRPSVNVLTGLIKANVPSRIAFSVPSQIDSRTILDMAGAERLLGRGDMLFVSPDLGKPRRLQGAFLSDEEIERVTKFLKDQGEVEYSDEVVEAKSSSLGFSSSGENFDQEDELYGDAKNAVITAGKASASLLQRRLRIGYARAARLLDILEEEGIIGPADGAKPRDILIHEENPSEEEVSEFKEERGNEE